ncbi:DUF2897 family protein [Psychromonas sp. Urea-02u-13]|uniref:DUF2897 family protein n=1 Tax=Psychromonas sp. Urea-02u-13 TaxID=2058326 RepID=UPI000C33F51D|nr:DUF2897 family protein [Psychromonas sp. Urea-02u-13]PKG37617.1 hypothetical protein CXF74_17975 [Psychromonas sp. Urea-02u-13]
MNGWLIFLIIAIVLGVILSNLLLLKQSAKHKIPDHIIKAVAARRLAEEQEAEKLETQNKKPTDD